jgi:hypothetical protein
MKKVTPEIEIFIADNCTLSGDRLSGLIREKFGIKISQPAIEPYLRRFRAEKEATNNAKVEAVRGKILDDADRWANKYLRYLDDEIESLRVLSLETKDLKVETIRDRAALSQSLQKALSMVLDFVKPEPAKETNISVDISSFSEEELEEYGRLAAKLAGVPKGESPPPSS